MPEEPSIAVTEAPQVLASATVILVGETHYYTPVESYLHLLGSVVAGPQFCIAVELPQQNGTFEEALQKLRKRARELKKKPGQKEALKRINRVVETYSKLLEMSSGPQLKIYGVDDAGHYNASLDLETRNRSIARNIAELLKSGKCERIMALLGKAHLTLGSRRKTTVKGLLTEAEISSLSINLQMTNEVNVPEEYQSFKTSGFTASLEDYEWLENKSVKRMIRVLPNLNGDISVWQEFDYTLLLPYNLKAQSF